MRGNKPMFWLKLHVSVNISVNSRRNYHKPLQTMTQTTTNDDMNHHKSQITTNHHKPWHKPPWTMTETSTKHDMNHYKSPQTMTWTIMMTQKELCIKPYGFLVNCFTSSDLSCCRLCADLDWCGNLRHITNGDHIRTCEHMTYTQQLLR